MKGDDFAASSYIEMRFSVPISQWAGAPNFAGQNDVEYSFNNSATTATNTTAFGYGPQGFATQSFAPSGITQVVKTVRFLTRIQPTDVISLQINDGVGGWTSFGERAFGFTSNNAGTVYYGAHINIANSTDVEVNFYSQAIVGLSWASLAGMPWRVVKSRAGVAVGFGLATDTNSGLITKERNGTHSSTLTMNGSGGTSASIDIKLARVGNYVSAYIPLFNATSGTSSDRFTLNTALPTWARPNFSQTLSQGSTRNNASVDGNISAFVVPASGIFLMFRNMGGSLYTNTASAGLAGDTVLTWYVGP